jgi:hypothetical protein
VSSKSISPLKPNPGAIEEMKYLCAILGADLFSEHSFPKPPENINWTNLLSLLQQHRLASRFYTLISKHKKAFPDSFLQELKKARYGLLIYGNDAVLQIQRILTALVDSGIPVIVLKGWAMISTFYMGDYAQRFCEDIDLLIRPQDFDRVESVLQSAGFMGFPEVHPGYSRRFSNARAYIQSDQKPNRLGMFSVGLHWGLTHYPYFQPGRIKIEDLFDRADSLEIAGINVRQLSIEDDLIYNCAHLALHHRNQETLLQYYEIAIRLCLYQEKFNWKQINKKAKLWGYSVQVKKILMDLEILWPGILKEEFLQTISAINPPIKEILLDSLVSRTKGNVFNSSIVQFLAMPCWRDKFASSFQQVFPSKDYMNFRYKSSKYPLFILYIKRLLGPIERIRRD